MFLPIQTYVANYRPNLVLTKILLRGIYNLLINVNNFDWNFGFEIKDVDSAII